MVSHDVQHKQPQHDDIQRDIDAYLAGGGQIERLSPEASSDGGVGFNNRKLNFRRRGGFDYDLEGEE